MKKIKKGFGILLLIFSGLYFWGSGFCFLAAITGNLGIDTFGESVAMAIFSAISAVISAFIMKLGWYLWKEKKIFDLLKIKKWLAQRKEKKQAALKKQRELESYDVLKRWKLEPFLAEDRIPFAAYGLERIYFEKLQNGSDVEWFFYAPNEIPVKLAMKKYQEYLKWRKEHLPGKDSAPQKAHIRISSEKALEGCDTSDYKQYLKQRAHIVINTGPYTFLDVTEGREYTVCVKPANEKKKMQEGEITGIWSFHQMEM